MGPGHWVRDTGSGTPAQGQGFRSRTLGQDAGSESRVWVKDAGSGIARSGTLGQDHWVRGSGQGHWVRDAGSGTLGEGHWVRDVGSGVGVEV